MQKGYYAASFCRILMARDFFTMDDFDLAGHTVLLRVDINSPVDPATGQLLNDARIREHLTTIRELRHSKVALLAHQSRPGKDDFTTLEAHAERIGALLGRPVRYVSSLFGRPAIEAIDAMQVGDVIVLENTRFYAEEEALADAKLDKMAKTHIVQRLAPHAEYFILDAFAAAHRAQPSLVGFCDVLPSLAGRVMERELTMLTQAVLNPEHPKVAHLGGVKADDSIAVAHTCSRRTSWTRSSRPAAWQTSSSTRPAWTLVIRRRSSCDGRSRTMNKPAPTAKIC